MIPDYLLKEDVAHLLGKSRQTIERWFACGKLEPYIVKGDYGREVQAVAFKSIPPEYRIKYQQENPSPPAESADTKETGTPPAEENRHCHQDPRAAEAFRPFEELTLHEQGQAGKRISVLKAIQSEVEVCPRGTWKSVLEGACRAQGVSLSTYYIWKKRHEQGGVGALADRPRSRKGKVTAEMEAYLVSLIKHNPDVRAPRLWEYLFVKFPNADVSGRTVERWHKRWKRENRSTWTFLRDPDAWKSQYQVAFGSESSKARYLNHYWELDSTKADILCADGRRYNLTACVDIWSRRARVLVTETSNSHAIAATLRACILDWGVPANIVRDNGKDYASNHVNGVCDALGVHAVTAPPFSPERKPHVERFFRTLSMCLFEELAGYCGHDVAGRKAIENRKSFAKRMMGAAKIDVALTPDELQGLIDRWISVIYHQRQHGGIGTAPEAQAGRSPVAARFIEDERPLDILLAPVGDAVVGKKGIRHQCGHYTTSEMHGWVGERVQVRVDPACAGTLYAFDQEGRYLFTARDESLAGRTAAEYAAARKAQRRAVNETRRAIETLHVEPMLELLDAKSAEPGRLRGLPRRKRMSNEQLEEAAKAKMQGQGVKPPQYRDVAEQMAADGHGAEPDPDHDLDDWIDRIEVVIE